jgi:hypothetical protein
MWVLEVPIRDLKSVSALRAKGREGPVGADVPWVARLRQHMIFFF